MVEGVALIVADLFAGRWTTIEQEHCTGGRMSRENLEHAPLMMLGEVKQTVSGDDSIKSTAQSQRAHIGHLPSVLRETR